MVQVGYLSATYLGLPLSVGCFSNAPWNPVVKRVEHWLASWKATCLSVGGRGHPNASSVIKSPGLLHIPVQMPDVSSERVGKLHRDFLGQGKESKKRFHLVDWKSVCKPRKSGGLGIKSLVHMNRALLGKWLWRLGEEGDSLWFQVVVA